VYTVLIRLNTAILHPNASFDVGLLVCVVL
jgi:hypothetical protein